MGTCPPVFPPCSSTIIIHTYTQPATHCGREGREGKEKLTIQAGGPIGGYLQSSEWLIIQS